MTLAQRARSYGATLNILTANAAARGDDRAAGPPREGTALLQGLVVCGRCGRRMTIRYHTRHGTQIPDYVCQNDGIRTAQPICQHLTGDIIDLGCPEASGQSIQ